MIVIRNVFHLKFGKAREATALMREGVAVQKKALAGTEFSTRLLTDLTGTFYTMVLEITVPNLGDFEAHQSKAMGNPEFQAIYRKMAELVDHGHREIFTVVE